jgi:hypothetical protein
VRLLLTLLFAAACHGKDDTASPPATSSTDSAADTAACVALTEGRWTGDGGCFGMTMSADLTLDADGCTFTFANWNMSMSVPEGGAVSGDSFAFTGFGWDDCAGTATATSMTGTCGGGCEIAMDLDD